MTSALIASISRSCFSFSGTLSLGVMSPTMHSATSWRTLRTTASPSVPSSPLSALPSSTPSVAMAITPIRNMWDATVSGSGTSLRTQPVRRSPTRTEACRRNLSSRSTSETSPKSATFSVPGNPTSHIFLTRTLGDGFSPSFLISSHSSSVSSNSISFR